MGDEYLSLAFRLINVEAYPTYDEIDAEKTEFSEIQKEYGDKIDEGRAKIIDEYRKMMDDLYSKGLKKIEATVDYIIKKILEVE